MQKRGLFIVIEGIDRSGKSTQVQKIYDAYVELNRTNNIKNGIKLMKFPNRETKIGALINSHLQSSAEDSFNYNLNVMHLLFSANRWEFKDEIIQLLQSGVTIICDRYVYSGICYSISKGSDKTWAFATEVGLPKPDLTIFMDLSPEKAASRADYGAERYEKLDFQKLVYEEFIHFCNSDSNLKRINGCRSEKEIFNDIWQLILPYLEAPHINEISYF